MTTEPLTQPQDRLQTVCDAFNEWRSSRRKERKGVKSAFDL